MLNQDQWTGIFRSLATSIVAYAAGKNWIPGDSIPLVVTALTAFGVAAWSVVTNSTKAKLTSAVADPAAPAIAKEIMPTPQVLKVANALKDMP